MASAAALLLLLPRRRAPPWPLLRLLRSASSSRSTSSRAATARGADVGGDGSGAGLKLRDYQRALLLEARRRLLSPTPQQQQQQQQQPRRLLCPVATGLGKTAIFANLPHHLRPAPDAPPPRTLVLVHRDELVRQAAEAFARWAPPGGRGIVVGVEKGRERVADPSQTDVVIASVQSLGRASTCTKRLGPYLRAWLGTAPSSTNQQHQHPPRDVLVVVDEAHHIAPGSTYDAVLGAFGLGSDAAAAMKRGAGGERAGGAAGRRKGPRTFLLGFTATPFRHDGVSLAHAFDGHLTLPSSSSSSSDSSVFPPEEQQLDLAWGIREGFLCDILAYRVQTVVTLDGLRVRMHDYARAALGKVVNRGDRHRAIVKAFAEHGGRQAIAFCADVAHARALALAFDGEGIPAAVVHGAMDAGERREVLGRFRDGALRVLTNYGVLTEGFDAPGCDTVLMARPTLSRGLYLQMLGRAARPDVPLPADAPAAERRRLIRASRKPHMRVIDVVDNLKRHAEAAAPVTLPSLLALPPAFDMMGASLDGVLRELKPLVAEARALQLPCPESLFAAHSLEDLRLRVQRFRLLGARALEEEEEGEEGEGLVSDIPADLLELQRARCKAKKEAAKQRAAALPPPHAPLAVPSELRPGDRIGMGGGGGKKGVEGVGGGPGRFAAHVVKIVALFRPPKRGGGGGGGGSRVKVAMVDGGGGRFAWETAGVKDDEKEPLHVGSHYLLSGVVKRNDLLPSTSSSNRGEVWLERAALHHLGREADALVAAHRQALWRQSQGAAMGSESSAAAAAAAAWDAALKAHFARRGGRKGLGRGVMVVGGARAAPASRRAGQELGEEGSVRHAGLLVAPHVSPGGGHRRVP